MASNPLVSVIVPTYNCAEFVADAIDSILHQGYEPLEIVVVDDGSSDDTLKVLSRYGDRIRLYTQPNGGPATARNRAVREARGEYLAFLDGDDLWLPGQPGLAMTYMQEHPQTKVVYGDWLVWMPTADGRYPDLARPPAVDVPEVDAAGTGWIYSKLLFDSVIHIIGAVIHRSVFDAVGGFDESLRTGSDYDFWVRVSRKYPAVKLAQPIAVYRHNLQSVTYTLRRENNAYRLLARAIEAYGLVDAEGHAVSGRAARERLADLAFVHGYRHFWQGNAAIAQQSFAAALRHRPLHAKALAYVAASLARRLGLFDPTRRRAARS